MIKRMKKNQSVEIYGKNKILDFTYIDDAVCGIIKCVENFFEAKNNVFNIASGHGEKIIQVAEMIKNGLNSKSKILAKSVRTGEVFRYTADLSKAKKMLGYKPNVSIKSGISLSIDWYLNNL